MSITADSPFRNVTRITRDRFIEVLKARANPEVVAERDPGEYWDQIVADQIDPLFILAMFNHESSMGKAGVAVTTHSWGNTRRPNFGAEPVGDVPGRTGSFPIWRNWMDGLKSTTGRLNAPNWVYHGRTRIREIFDHPSGDVWAPAGDLNNPAGYLRAMLDFMNLYKNQNGDAPMAGDDARFAWTPDEHEFGYPTRNRGRSGKPILYLILHTTEGTDSQAWLRNQNGSSTHYLTDRQFKPRAQHVREADAAWTAGHREYNERGINLELEHKAGQAITPVMYRNAAETVKPILDRHGIPPVYLGRDPMKNKPGQKGIIGHGDVPPPNDHTDPTAPWNWDTFMAALLSLYEGDPPVEGPRKFETGFAIRGRIRDFWERAEKASVAYQGIGLPTSDEYDATHEGKPVVRQDFERAVLQYDPSAEFPWDVTALFRTDLPSDVKAQLADVLEKLDQVRQIVAA